MATAPTVIGSIGKKPGEWIGSRYIGPAAPAPAPTPAPSSPLSQRSGVSTDGTTNYPSGSVAAASPQGPASARTPYTREEYDRLTPAQKAAWSGGATRSSVDTMGMTAPPTTNTSGSGGSSGAWTSAQREQFKNAWLSTGTDKAAQDRLAAQYGISVNPRNGRAQLPTGEVIDLRIGAAAGGTQAAWTGVAGHGAKYGQTPGWSSTQSGGRSGGTASSGSPTGGSSTAPSGISAELYDLLLARARQGTAIDRNDPNIRQQVEPFQAEQERARRNYLADLAESAGPGANIRGETRLASERAGQASGMLEAQLIGSELQARRDEIMHALDSLRGQLSTDQTLALQKELAYLEDATRRYGIKTDADTARSQISLGRDRLGLDYNYFDWARDPSNPSNIPNFNG